MALVMVVLCFLESVSKLSNSFERTGNVFTKFDCELFKFPTMFSRTSSLHNETLISEYKHLHVLVVVVNVLHINLENVVL